ncbi:MAG: hypothetical protein HYT97_08180 [Elusimicrobia bacterium]|nr:hypothetical protein [Elusimicrobiota bacterium]
MDEQNEKTQVPEKNFLRRAADLKMMEEIQILKTHLELAKKDLARFEKTKTLAHVAPSVVHDIRNSLGVISSTSQFVLSILKPDEKERQAWELVQRNVENIKNLLKSYLQLAREVENTKQKCSINEIVNSVAHFIEIQAKKQNTSIEKNLAKNLPLLNLDMPAIESSVLNIAINALESLENQGAVKFRTYSDEKGENLFLEIEDTGPGISPENLERIFSPFFTTKKTGTGMGLYSAKAAVENNDGKITCKSKLGEGSKMILEFSVGPS